MNQIPQQQIFYPNIYTQIPNHFSHENFLQNQISQNNIIPSLNFNINDQSKFIIF
jgi:hypothetical protein